MKHFFKKLTSMLLTTATFVASVNLTPLAQNVSAASWTTGDNVNVVCNYFPYSYNFSGSGLTSIYGQFPDLTADGQIAYCCDSLANSGGGGNNSNFRVGTDLNNDDTVSLALAYGYTGKTKYGYSAETEQLATQIMVWCIEDGWYDNGSESTALNYFTAGMGSTLASNVKTVYSKIKAGMKEYKKTPSFNSTTVNNKMTYNSSTKKWTLTLSDSNGIANKFDWSSALSKYSYLSVSATANSVTFTSTKAFDTITLTANYNNSAFTAIKGVPLTPIAGQNNQQPCVSYKDADPYTATIKLYAEENTGDLKIIKTSDDGKVSGITFDVRWHGTESIGTFTTNSKGEILISDLKVGAYVIYETVPEGYKTQYPQTVNVEANKTAEVTFNNVLKKGDLKIIKTSEDGIIKDISFKVEYDASDGHYPGGAWTVLGTFKTDENGEILIKGLKPRMYRITEIVPDGYKEQEAQIVTVEYDKTAEVKFRNVPLKGDLKIIKTADDDNVSNIGFDIVRNIYNSSGIQISATYIGKYYTDENGEILIKDLRPGRYTVIETVPSGYEPQASQVVTVEYGKTAEVSFHNILAKSDLMTTASIGGEKAAFTKQNDTITIDDVISYTDLIVGREYVIKGVLMDKSTGKEFLVNGKQVTVESKFTASKTSGFVKVSFSFPASAITKKTELVVFEEMYYNDVKIAEHSDINDLGQTVSIHVPSIGTTATVNGVKDIFSANGTVTIKDTVSYTDLIASSSFAAGVDSEYTLQAVLMDKATGQPFLVNGKQITAEKKFTTETENGSVDVSLSFNASAITENTELVVFESLYFHGVKIAEHSNINDKGQTVTVHAPTIGTTAAFGSGKDAFSANGNITLKDVVSYTDLVVGKEYTLKGVLMNKATGAQFTVNGKPVTSEAKFTATSANGLTIVNFTFDVSGVTANTDLVVYEELYYGSLKIAEHRDINDEKQTVTVHAPKIGTTAAVNNEKDIFSANGSVTLKDVVSYSDLIVGKEYTLKGILMNKATGAAFTVNGKSVEAEAKFTAAAASGSATVTFTFDVSGVNANTDLVVYEELYYGSLKIAEHKNINNKGQTVTVHAPSMGTTATVGSEKDTFSANGTITLKDVVSYSDLIVGKEYTLKGVLMNKATGAQFTVNGKPVTSEVKFTANSANGSATVTFTFNVSGINANTDLVVYEELYLGSLKIAEHKNINDKGQTVTVHTPKLETTATSADEKHAFAIGMVSVKDVVSYTDLIIGKEYTVKGTLMNKATGKEFTIGGKPVEAVTTFTAENTNGTVEVVFVFDTSEITANTTVVAFERLYHNKLEIAAHTDINDKDQSVELHKPSAQTTAKVGEDKEVFAFNEIVLKDTVEYTDLIVGKKYTVSGVLMDKATGKAFLVNGKQVTASAEFTAKTANGEVVVTFVFDGSGITQNTDLVVFERIYQNGIEIAAHTDINDKSQTIKVRIPKIGTTAAVNNEKDIFSANGTVTLKDVVSYTDLIAGKEYTLKGILMNKITGAVFTVNGKPVEAEAKFTAAAANGSATVTFTFDVSAIDRNTDLVVFESLYFGGVKIAEHSNMSDKRQTVTVHAPKLETTATSNEEKDTFAVGMVSVKDVVSYSDLIVGKEYTVKGTLMNKATGKEFIINGKPVEATAAFTAESTEGTVEVTFVFDASEITANTTVVAFERLYQNGIEVAAHTDIDDEDQSVELHKPGAQTTAKVGEDKEVFAFEKIVLEDTVEYSDLIAGKKYTVSGVLMNKATGEAFLVNGEQVTASAEFTAKSANGEVVVIFVFDGSGITRNTDLVVFERVYQNGIEVAAHTDINDESQTIKVRTPDIGTSAAVSGETITDEKEVFGQGEITIIDTVTYHDLIIGKEYNVQGVLMNRLTGEMFAVNGVPVFAETTFTAEANDGEVVVTFVFNVDQITENTSLVVFEALYYDGVKIAEHTDIEDEGQTVVLRSPKLETTADVNGEKDVFAVGTVTVTDYVDYHDLIIGKEYTVRGVLMNKATNKPFLVNGEEITAEATFIAEATDGQVIVTFIFDASEIEVNTTVVAFETLYHEGIEVAAHANIYDEGQSVQLHKPSISTVATINGAKEIFAVKNVTVNDTISYTDLVIGREYTIRGVLMNKATGLPFLMNGAEVTSETTFTAESTDGEVEVAFTFDASGLTEDTELVVFESLYQDNVELAAHADIEDMGQTVSVHPHITIEEEPPKGPAIPDTGVNFVSEIMAFALAAAAVIIYKRRRNSK